MADIKSDSEMLAEIYRNTHYALQSISDVLPETEDEKMPEPFPHLSHTRQLSLCPTHS